MKKNILNLIPFMITIGCIIAFNIIGSKVLSDGTLVEPFYLIPIGYLFFFIGIIGLCIRMFFSFKNKRTKIEY
ncbi:MAG: DUF3955 domain-containing protein [Clostridium sp.]|uniref:DUF3955 domain-containing protein n=1 Tax=Clostridium sp. TaxID=1506 RepID=UPI002FC730C3